MNFKEMLEKYKNGTANEEEILLVEEELAKNELINEYLSEQMDTLPSLEALEEDFSKDAKKIKMALNRRIWTVVLAVVLICALLFAVIKYIALPLYDEQFYDPYKVAEGVPDLRDREDYQEYMDSFNPLNVNVDVFLDLFCPGWYAEDEVVRPWGMGNYDVLIRVGKTMGEHKEYNARLEKGKLQQGLRSEWFFPTSSMGRFFEKGSDYFTVTYVDENGNESRKQQEDNRESYRKELEKLPESCIIESYITFTENKSMEELLEWKKNMTASVSWVAVETGEGCHLDEIGFDMDSGGFILETTDEFDAMFPYLQINSSNTKHGEETAEQYEQHYKSMLKYMSCQEDFLNAFCDVNNKSNVEDYEKALRYAEENGISIYGAVLVGNRNEMVELEQRQEINSFVISDVRLSLYD